MNKYESENRINNEPVSRRKILTSGAAGIIALMTGSLIPGSSVFAEDSARRREQTEARGLVPGAFVYTEVQNSVPFNQIPWAERNPVISAQEGFISKTWLSGLGNNSVGGFYSFDSIENAQKYVTEFFPDAQRRHGNAYASRIFDASVVRDASIDMGSTHFGIPPKSNPGAFVYTEVQVSIPFEEVPWMERNKALKKVPGLIGKTWLSGLNTHTIGGFDVFDTVENAKRFAIDDFPTLGKKFMTAIYARVFDASVTEQASRDMHSPLYFKDTLINYQNLR